MSVLRFGCFRRRRGADDGEVPVSVRKIGARGPVRRSLVGRAAARVGFGEDSIVSAGHGAVVRGGGFVGAAWVAVEEVHKGFVGVVVEAVDFVAVGEQVRDRFRRRLVRDGRADYVGHVAVV